MSLPRPRAKRPILNPATPRQLESVGAYGKLSHTRAGRKLRVRSVFLSFKTEDLPRVNLFRGQAENATNDLDFRDYSIKSPFESAWKTNAELIIRKCSVTLCLIGPSTWLSDAVDWELRKSFEAGKAVIGVLLYPDRPVVTPPALSEYGITPMPWDIQAIASEIEQKSFWRM